MKRPTYNEQEFGIIDQWRQTRSKLRAWQAPRHKLLKFPRCIPKMLQRTSTQSIRTSQLFRSSSCHKPSQCLRQISLLPRYTLNCPKPAFTARPFSSTRRRHNEQLPDPPKKLGIRENIYTLPNLLTVSRICSCPILAWSIVDGNYYLATGLLVYAGLTDAVREANIYYLSHAFTILEGRRLSSSSL